MIVVDTPIWSLALRRGRDPSQDEGRDVAEWERLVRAGRAALIGPIRQEFAVGRSRRAVDLQSHRPRSARLAEPGAFTESVVGDAALAWLDSTESRSE